MSEVYADWKRYNANANNKNVGDCVKRGLSVAYSMDYNDVGKELNRIKRARGYDKFNVYPVFNKFVELRGDKFIDCKDIITVGEFSEIYNDGVYLILCGKEPGARRMSHMTVVVDGDFYDSWDSSEYYVVMYAPVSGGKSDVFELDIEELSYKCAEYIITYVFETLNKKYSEFLELDISYDSLKILDSNTFEMKLIIKFLQYNNSQYYNANYSVYRTKFDNVYNKDGYVIAEKRIIFKSNPRMSLDENYNSIIKKSKSQLYNYVRKFGEMYLDCAKSVNIKDMVQQRHGYVDYDALAKLPEECYKDVFEYYPKERQGDPFILTLRDSDTGKLIDFTFMYLKDLKKAIQHYYATGEVLQDGWL